MSKPKFIEGTSYPIQPKNIDVSGNFPLLGAFGHRETEMAAVFIIQVCQQKGRWAALTQHEWDDLYRSTQMGQIAERQLDNFMASPIFKKYNKNSRPPLFLFYDLDLGGLVVRGDDNRYRVTEGFILRCLRYSTKSANKALCFFWLYLPYLVSQGHIYDNLIFSGWNRGASDISATAFKF